MFLANTTQSVPHVLYIIPHQKLEFEFEKNLKIMLTICIPKSTSAVFLRFHGFLGVLEVKILLLPQIFLLNAQTYLGI